jgi:peptide/nickel transport system substrate-binding protein
LIAALLVCAAMLSWGGPQKEGAAAAGTTTAAGGFKESPDFAARVKAGTLPAVNLRLPPEPVVIQAPTVGKYGGSLNLLLIDGNAWAGELPDSIDGNPALMRTVGPGKYAPDMATSCTVASDFRSWTCVLRDGLKWSDGTPLTVEDAIFTVKDMGINDKVNIWAGFNPKSITKIDDKTIRYEFNAPIFKAESMIAAPTNGGIEIFQPMHYLRKWHIDYNPDANKIAKEEGFEQWFEALYAHFWWAPVTDANKPTFGPYINTQLDSSVRAWEANPFYHHVDQSGQQLPYIPKAVGQIVDPEVKNLRTIAGDVDLNWMQTSFDNFTLYQENAKANN